MPQTPPQRGGGQPVRRAQSSPPQLTGSTPAFVRVADDLRRRILAGEWETGEQLPSHRSLMEFYGVSSTTMGAARKILLSEALLEARAGARMVVRRPPDRRRIDRTGPSSTEFPLSLHQQETNAGRHGEWASRTRTTVADPVVASLLRILAGDGVVETRYQHRAAGVLTRLATCWEPRALTDGSPVMLPEDGPYAGHSVEDRMAVLGVGPLTAVDELVARPASFEEDQLLGVGPGAPVLEVTRTYTGPDGRPVHVERSVVRGDTAMMLYRLPGR